jgi:hypothetical protein
VLTDDELDQITDELLDFIRDRAADLVTDPDDEQSWLTAALEVDAGVRKVGPRVTRALYARALRAGLSQAAVARVRGVTRQSVNGAVKAA